MTDGHAHKLEEALRALGQQGNDTAARIADRLRQLRTLTAQRRKTPPGSKP